MFKRFLRWLWSFSNRRQVMRYLSAYETAGKSEDRTVWINDFFTQQTLLLKGPAFEELYINRLPSANVYIYGSVEETKRMFDRFLTQLQQNSAINTHDLQEFMVNSTSTSLHAIFREDVGIKEQLLELNDILYRILLAYNEQPGSYKTLNLSRIIALFEMMSIIVARVSEGYLTTI